MMMMMMMVVVVVRTVMQLQLQKNRGLPTQDGPSSMTC
jgi:hypothetical protein